MILSPTAVPFSPSPRYKPTVPFCAAATPASSATVASHLMNACGEFRLRHVGAGPAGVQAAPEGSAREKEGVHFSVRRGDVLGRSFRIAWCTLWRLCRSVVPVRCLEHGKWVVLWRKLVSVTAPCPMAAHCIHGINADFRWVYSEVEG